LTLIDETHWDLGQFDQATANKDTPLMLWREAGEPDGEAETLYNRAVDFHHRGTLDAAMEYAQAAQSRWIDAQNPRGEANRLPLPALEPAGQHAQHHLQRHGVDHG